MNLLQLFPTVVGTIQRDDISDHPSVLEALDKEWKIEPRNGLVHTSNGLQYNDALKDVHEFVTNSVVEYLQSHEFVFDSKDLYIASCWANMSLNEIKSHEAHYHYNSLVSAVYYPSVPKGSGGLVFQHPNPALNLLQPNVGKPNSFNSPNFRLQPEEGMCVVFRSSTLHSTIHNQFREKQRRVSIGYTFNIKDIGRDSHSSNYEEL
jgi:uncharacterized protein (TIGR02466 family)